MTALKPYFIARCKAVDLVEHKDAFNEENIPQLDKAFHVLLGDFSGMPQGGREQQFSCPVTVTFWIKGYKNPSEGLDKAVQKAEALVKECLKPANRLGTLIKNVFIGSVKTDAASGSNDNVVKVTLSFSTIINLDL
jgi:hypothetical protein